MGFQYNYKLKCWYTYFTSPKMEVANFKTLIHLYNWKLLNFRGIRRNVSSYDSSIRTEISKPQRKEETNNQTRARLLYQSRKRGMLENGLLLSTFANKYLNELTPAQVKQYDKLINEPSNDWDIYYWLTGKVEPPEKFKNEVFEMLQKHTQNAYKEQRYHQPDLHP